MEQKTLIEQYADKIYQVPAGIGNLATINQFKMQKETFIKGAEYALSLNHTPTQEQPKIPKHRVVPPPPDIPQEQLGREWISVHDEFPANGTECLLITIEDEKFFYHVAEYNNDEWSTPSEILYYAAYWMSLPEPPKP